MNVKSRKAEQSEATRGALVRVARKLFTTKGYAATGTEEIVRRAGVTRGALYHHFIDKRELFAAIFKEISREVMQEVGKAADAGGERGTWGHFVAGCNGFLDVCLRPDVQRIMLLDGPSVLGWETWRDLDAKHGFATMCRALESVMQSGFVDAQPVEPLAHMLLGALNEAALAMARSADMKKARAEMGAAIDRVLEGLKKA